MTPKRSSAATSRAAKPAPDQERLVAKQAERLAKLTGMSAADFKNATVSQLAERFKWDVDPVLFFFRRLCGKVVKTDTTTGIDYPVPFATVHVYDTDCNFLGFFPEGWPWAWYFPLWCSSEEIATATTDGCGNFCVWIPRFDIDWVLRWREEWICYRDIFAKPTIDEILRRAFPPPPADGPMPHGPGPGPDPLRALVQDGGMGLRAAEQVIGRTAAQRLAAARTNAKLGTPVAQLKMLTSGVAFPTPLAPPLPKQLVERFTKNGHRGLAAHLGVATDAIEGLDLHRYIGPFWRCDEFFVPEIVPIFDVPDITFGVTQDVDADGDEETIYSESFFDARWVTGDIPDVTLHTSQIAVSTKNCNVPSVDCSELGLRFVGLMPLQLPYHDVASGFALRPNRPHPLGLFSSPPSDPASTPYTHTLQLYGCNHYAGASYYRVRYSFNGSASVPFQNLTWPVYPWPAGTPAHWVLPDADGWYPILAEGAWWPDHLLLEWATGQTGTYAITVDFGDAAKATLFETPAVSIVVDNDVLVATFTELRWKVASDTTWSEPLELVCPVIVRPVVAGTPVSIDFKVSYLGSTTYFRSIQLTGGGCGGVNLTSTSPASTTEHWSTGPTDNSFTAAAEFNLAAGAPQGAYSFGIYLASRAFNPAGGDACPLADWICDPVYRWLWAYLPVAVVNQA